MPYIEHRRTCVFCDDWEFLSDLTQGSDEKPSARYHAAHL